MSPKEQEIEAMPLPQLNDKEWEIEYAQLDEHEHKLKELKD